MRVVSDALPPKPAAITGCVIVAAACLDKFQEVPSVQSIRVKDLQTLSPTKPTTDCRSGLGLNEAWLVGPIYTKQTSTADGHYERVSKTLTAQGH